MKLKHQRLVLILGGLLGLGLAAFLILSAFSESLVFFYTPSDLKEKELLADSRIRVGGIVEPSSLVVQGEHVTFTISDNKNAVKVRYKGLLPDLFREGQGVVAEGRLTSTAQFEADLVLAKHDETYMPREVAESLKDEGCPPYAR